MKFFWQKSQQSEPQVETQNESAPFRAETPDYEGLARVAAHEAAKETALEVTRAIAANTISQQQTQQTQHPIYAYDNPITFSTPVAPRGRPSSQVSVDTLRQVADNYDILRACIQHLKREVTAVPIGIVPKDDKDTSPKTRRQIRDATAFLEVFGGLGGTGQRRQHFERQIIEDVLVVGAAAMFHDVTLGGALNEVIAIDAATIRPIVDGFGFAPEEDAPVYEQWVQGMVVAKFTRQQLRYDGLQPTSYTPYFKSPIEWVLGPINAALRADAWNLAWLTDGNSANQIFALPDDWKPDAIKAWFALWEAQNSGSSKQRQKTRFVPGGTAKVGTESRKDADFQEFEWWLARRTFAVMGVQPASVGYVGEQYKVSQDGSMASTSLFGAGELLDFRKETYDDLWVRMGFDRIQTRNVMSREEDAKQRAERHEIEIRSGKRSINECRQESGDEPTQGGDVHLVSNGLVLLDSVGTTPVVAAPVAAVATSGDASPQTNANAQDGTQAADSETPGEATAARSELSQWERKALKRLKEKGGAACSFESAHISREIKRAINRGLETLAPNANKDAVRALFRSTKDLDAVADEIQSLSGEISASEAANLLQLLQRAQTIRFNRVLENLIADEASVASAETALYDALTQAHANAAHLGRRLAGDDSTFGDYAQNIGTRVADEQIQYAEKFAKDIADGKYTNDEGTVDEDAIARRAGLYEKRLRGTANEGWVNALDEPIYWVLGDANHCTECEALAGDSPYKPHELPTIPGNGETPCVMNCGCSLRTESGATGF